MRIIQSYSRLIELLILDKLSCPFVVRFLQSSIGIPLNLTQTLGSSFAKHLTQTWWDVNTLAAFEGQDLPPYHWSLSAFPMVFSLPNLTHFFLLENPDCRWNGLSISSSFMWLIGFLVHSPHCLHKRPFVLLYNLLLCKLVSNEAKLVKQLSSELQVHILTLCSRNIHSKS